MSSTFNILHLTHGSFSALATGLLRIGYEAGPVLRAKTGSHSGTPLGSGIPFQFRTIYRKSPCTKYCYHGDAGSDIESSEVKVLLLSHFT